jgi:hypothetical protein
MAASSSEQQVRSVPSAQIIELDDVIGGRVQIVKDENNQRFLQIGEKEFYRLVDS